VTADITVITGTTRMSTSVIRERAVRPAAEMVAAPIAQIACSSRKSLGCAATPAAASRCWSPGLAGGISLVIH
jgi:hypothetical protein